MKTKKSNIGLNALKKKRASFKRGGSPTYNYSNYYNSELPEESFIPTSSTEGSIDQSQNTKDKKILFICGMPRSGTTLLEQIISAHTKVDSLGETEFLGKIFNKIDLKNFDLKETYENLNS